VIRLLTKDGADCKAQHSEDLIYFFHAINEGWLDVVRVLVADGGASLDIRDKYCKRAIDNVKRNLKYARNNEFLDDDYINQMRDVNKNPTRCNSMQIFIYLS